MSLLQQGHLWRLSAASRLLRRVVRSLGGGGACRDAAPLPEARRAAEDAASPARRCGEAPSESPSSLLPEALLHDSAAAAAAARRSSGGDERAAAAGMRPPAAAACAAAARAAAGLSARVASADRSMGVAQWPILMVLFFLPQVP
jgi:hypothetical protein